MIDEDTVCMLMATFWDAAGGGKGAHRERDFHIEVATTLAD